MADRVALCAVHRTSGFADRHSSSGHRLGWICRAAPHARESACKPDGLSRDECAGGSRRRGTSPRSDAKKSGRTLRRATPRRRPTSGGTTTMPRSELIVHRTRAKRSTALTRRELEGPEPTGRLIASPQRVAVLDDAVRDDLGTWPAFAAQPRRPRRTELKDVPRLRAGERELAQDPSGTGHAQFGRGQRRQIVLAQKTVVARASPA
jgi:hypothetical protein